MSDRKRPLTVEDLWLTTRPGAPAAPADGSFAVIPVTRYDMESNESSTRLYRVDGAGMEPCPLTAETLTSSQPALSPDAKRVAFVRADEDKRGQLAVLPLDGGEAEILTDMPLGMTDPKWFPGGDRIAFLAQVFKEAPTLEGTATHRDLRKDEQVKAYVTEDCIYRYWDNWLTEGKTYHVFVIDLATREIRDLTPGFEGWFEPDGAEGSWDIAPDGSEIAFCADRSASPHRRLNWDVFLVRTDGGEIRNITEANPGHDSRPRYTPDGKSILYGMTRITEFYADRVRLVRYDRGSGEHHVLTEDWDRSAAAWEFLPDGSGMVVLADDVGTTALFRTGFEPGTPERLYRGGHLQGLTVLTDGSVLSVWDSLSAPPEIARVTPTGNLEFWTAFNRELYLEIELGEVREGETVGADGRPIQYYEVRPAGFTPDETWPMVLAIHGGPHGIWADTFHFRWNMQLFAAPGYVVVAPNPHGSTSFGQEFADSIQGGWGDKPYVDCMAVTDALVDSGYVDAKRMAAVGGSYGGYMVAWIAGQTDRFACLVNHAGVSNLLSQFASDVTEGRGRALGGTSWEGIETVDRMNPVRHAAGFASPMLVIHGELDYRVPVNQGLEIYNTYKALELPARLVVYPDENHWILKPQNSRLWYREVHSWLDRWLG